MDEQSARGRGQAWIGVSWVRGGLLLGGGGTGSCMWSKQSCRAFAAKVTKPPHCNTSFPFAHTSLTVACIIVAAQAGEEGCVRDRWGMG